MCQLGQRLDEKMPVLSVFCVYENNSLRAWFSLLYDKCNTNFSTNQIRVSFPCSRSRVAKHLTGFPLLLEFSVSRRFRSRFPLAAGMCTSRARSEGQRWERSGRPGAQRGAGRAVESYSPELLQELPRSSEMWNLLGRALRTRLGALLPRAHLLWGREILRVIYHVSLLQEIWFNRPNLNLLLILLISCKYLCFSSVFSLKTILISGTIILHENDSKHDSVWEVMDKNRPIFIQSYSVFSPSLCIVPEPMHTAGQ